MASVFFFTCNTCAATTATTTTKFFFDLQDMALSFLYRKKSRRFKYNVRVKKEIDISQKVEHESQIANYVQESAAQVRLVLTSRNILRIK